ncbi:hypothetical protein WJX72_011428 [[Myrmecia] bisecta]|uniref:Uncharacterized protein n=1 Tax=[Myrmecia] bisecta TaxID=41462 RepID=A0AAW1PDI2_9CHLO
MRSVAILSSQQHVNQDLNPQHPKSYCPGTLLCQSPGTPFHHLWPGSCSCSCSRPIHRTEWLIKPVQI